MRQLLEKIEWLKSGELLSIEEKVPVIIDLYVSKIAEEALTKFLDCFEHVVYVLS